MELIIARIENGRFQVRERNSRLNFFGCAVEETVDIGPARRTFCEALETLAAWAVISGHE